MVITSSEEPVKLGPKRHGVNGHRVIAVHVKDANLQHCSVPRRPDEHGQVFAHVASAYGVANRVQYVVVGDAVVPCGRADPHLDNIACLTERVHRAR